MKFRAIMGALCAAGLMCGVSAVQAAESVEVDAFDLAVIGPGITAGQLKLRHLARKRCDAIGKGVPASVAHDIIKVHLRSARLKGDGFEIADERGDADATGYQHDRKFITARQQEAAGGSPGPENVADPQPIDQPRRNRTALKLLHPDAV